MSGASGVMRSSWTAFGLLAVYDWLWMAVGSESVRLDGVTSSIARRPFRIPGARKFEWHRVRSLRVDPIRSRRRPFMGLNRDPIGGAIAFDYVSRTYRFAEVDELEAAMLIRELESRFGTRSAA